MSNEILQTKLYIPKQRANLVQRTRLLARLNEGYESKLTLISAPAGFGKTTLVSAWVADCGRPVAWLSLDPGDNDPLRFLTYLVGAVQTIVPHVGSQMLALLQSPQPPPIDSLLTALLNEIATIPQDFILVLDDYHAISEEAIDGILSFALEHLPPQLHLVIATREDPQLPLARHRARGQLTELRATDLRFTYDEAGTFLNQTMGLDLSAQEVVALETRTEGWIVGLQLASLALQGMLSVQSNKEIGQADAWPIGGRSTDVEQANAGQSKGKQSDTASFIQSFTGSHRFVLDYLVEEVLQQQPYHIQNFLLHTSICQRLCGPLCDAILDVPSTSSQAILTYMEQANLFIIPLDNERRWYRYHHLFAELLQQRLSQAVSANQVTLVSGGDASDASQAPIDQGVTVEILHKRASIWYEENGWVLEAFQHAVAANDLPRAERLVDGNGTPLYFRGIVNPIVKWLQSLPTSVMDAQPSLWITLATALTLSGHPVAKIEEQLQAAEANLLIRDLRVDLDVATKNLLGHIAAVRAMLAIPTNEIAPMLAQSQRALDYLRPDNLALRTTVSMTLGYAYLLQGDSVAARQAYTEMLSMAEASGNTTFILAGLLGLASVYEVENQLALAVETYERTLKLAGEPPPPFICAAYFGLTKIFYEWNDFEAVHTYAQQGIHYGRQLPSLDIPAACQVVLIRVKLAQGDLDGAAALMAEVDQFMGEKETSYPLPEIEMVRVDLLLQQGELAKAARLAENHALPLALARVYLASGKTDATLASLEEVRQQTVNQPVEALKGMALEAVTRHIRVEKEIAIQRLQDALVLAEAGGSIRTFVDEGAPMAQLLTEAASSKVVPEYVDKLLAAFESENLPTRDGFMPILPLASQPLIDPLSQREVEVLHLVAQGFSNRAISERLILALDTVKGHNRKIFGKLQVKNRTEAVARARELGLL
ncbi:MAG: LuxR C-terminal-related transcriptional regulator [Chloroflexota bacterium]